jgi:hypothetical protein
MPDTTSPRTVPRLCTCQTQPLWGLHVSDTAPLRTSEPDNLTDGCVCQIQPEDVVWVMSKLTYLRIHVFVNLRRHHWGNVNFSRRTLTAEHWRGDFLSCIQRRNDQTLNGWTGSMRWTTLRWWIHRRRSHLLKHVQGQSLSTVVKTDLLVSISVVQTWSNTVLKHSRSNILIQTQSPNSRSNTVLKHSTVLQTCSFKHSPKTVAQIQSSTQSSNTAVQT